MKNYKGEIATLLTLGLVIVGAVVTLASSLLVNKNKNFATNSRAAETDVTCDGTKACGSGSAYNCNSTDGCDVATCNKKGLEFACYVADSGAFYGCIGTPCSAITGVKLVSKDQVQEIQNAPGYTPTCTAGSYMKEKDCEDACGKGNCQPCKINGVGKYECKVSAHPPSNLSSCVKPRTYASETNCKNEGCTNCTQCTFSGAIRYECDGTGPVQGPQTLTSWCNSVGGKLCNGIWFNGETFSGCSNIASYSSFTAEQKDLSKLVSESSNSLYYGTEGTTCCVSACIPEAQQKLTGNNCADHKDKDRYCHNNNELLMECKNGESVEIANCKGNPGFICKDNKDGTAECVRKAGSTGATGIQGPIGTSGPIGSTGVDIGSNIISSIESCEEFPGNFCSKGKIEIMATKYISSTSTGTSFYCCGQSVINTIKSQCTGSDSNYTCIANNVKIDVYIVPYTTGAPNTIGTCNDNKATTISYASYKCRFEVDANDNKKCGKNEIVYNNNGCIIYRACPFTGSKCQYDCYKDGKKYNCAAASDPNLGYYVIHVYNNMNYEVTVRDSTYTLNEPKPAHTYNLGEVSIKPGESYTYDISSISTSCSSGPTLNSIDTHIKYYFYNSSDKITTGSLDGHDGCGGGVKILINIK